MCWFEERVVWPLLKVWVLPPVVLTLNLGDIRSSSSFLFMSQMIASLGSPLNQTLCSQPATYTDTQRFKWLVIQLKVQKEIIHFTIFFRCIFTFPVLACCCNVWPACQKCRLVNIFLIGCYFSNVALVWCSSHPITLHTPVTTHFVCWVQTGSGEGSPSPASVY